jgi:hypothetical protein
VPYLNGVRRLGAPWIRRRQAAIRGGGGSFYQYAFTRPEFVAALRRRRFEPLAATPYDPARVLRTALRGVRRRAAGGPPRVPAAPPAGPRPWLARLARRALYTGPALRLLGHMLLVVARRA